MVRNGSKVYSTPRERNDWSTGDVGRSHMQGLTVSACNGVRSDLPVLRA